MLFNNNLITSFLIFKLKIFVNTLGSRILQLTDIPQDQLYKMKLKGVMICFGILRAALCGGYVNFGVFNLYGDTCLEDALSIFVKMVLAVPQSEILVGLHTNFQNKFT